MTIYDVQNAQKAPIWKQRIIECRSSGKSVKEWCKEHGLDFTTYYRWERKILGISEKRNVCFGPAERSFRLKRNRGTLCAVVNL